MLIGPSGSRKSILIRWLNPLENVNTGVVLVDGVDVADPKGLILFFNL